MLFRSEVQNCRAARSRVRHGALDSLGPCTDRFHEDHGCRAASQRLEADAARSREEVEKPRSLQGPDGAAHGVQDAEQGQKDPAGGGADLLQGTGAAFPSGARRRARSSAAHYSDRKSVV